MHDLVAIVILNYNGAAYLKKFLPTVLQCSRGYRVVVADNASTDNSIGILNETFPEVEVLQLSRNWGFAGGYNKALEQISARYYLLLNSDVEVTPGWVAPLVALLEGNNAIAACQPKIRSFHQPAYFEYAGAAGGFLDWLGYPFCRGRLFDTLEKDNGQYNEARPIFWATGAALFIRSEAYWQMGGFDEDFFAHMEEIDLCWRLHAAGRQVWACPESEVYHVGGGTLSKENPRKTYLNFRNGLWMLIKNTEEGLWYKLPLRLLLDWAAALQLAAKGHGAAAQAVIRSHVHTMKSVEILHKKRLENKKLSVKKVQLYARLVIVDYFIFKRKYFSQLKN